MVNNSSLLKNFLQLNNVEKNFSVQERTCNVLSECTYEFQQNRSYAIMGSSGSGKSTLLHLMAGLDSPTKGSITMNGDELSCMSSINRALSVGVVAQTPYFIGCLTVLENVIIAGLALDMDYATSKHRAMALLTRLDINKYASANTGMLSGGQRQRVSLARTLMHIPQFLLADELTGNLDYTCALNTIDYIKKVQKEEDIGLILVTHSFEIAQQMDTIVIIENGKLKEM